MIRDFYIFAGRRFFAAGLTVFCIAVLCSLPLANAQLAPGSMNVRWDEGAPDCKKTTQPPLQVHRYNEHTIILRESLCTTFEAPFMYLLIGSTKAMLIDSGDVADPAQVPLAKTVMDLLPTTGPGELPLLLVHTHRHLDHRSGDIQFAPLSNVQIVGFDLDSVRRFYGFAEWPNGLAQIDLGGRIVDAIPTPGHNPTEVSFYDRNTGLFFSGDFLMPARLLIEDTQEDLASAERVAAFLRDRPVSYVLGGHIEANATRQLFPWQSQYHPNEHVLQLAETDVRDRCSGFARHHSEVQRHLHDGRCLHADEPEPRPDATRRTSFNRDCDAGSRACPSCAPTPNSDASTKPHLDLSETVRIRSRLGPSRRLRLHVIEITVSL
jgi:glyoxylase-like metal-dependent hydrolase (beta-lactamase superfamily II)